MFQFLCWRLITGLPFADWSNDEFRILTYCLLIRSFFLALALLQGGQLLLFHDFNFAIRSFGDIDKYFEIAKDTFSRLPYVVNPIEYPQAATYLFLLISLITGREKNTFALMLNLVQFPIELSTSLLIFRMGRDLIGRKRAFAGAIAYSLSPMVLYTWMSRYDCIPTFLTVLATYLLIRHESLSAFLLLGGGAMFKWYPIVLLPIFGRFLHENGRSRRSIGILMVGAVALCALYTLPFLALDARAFFQGAYGYHLSRTQNFESLPALLALIMYGNPMTRIDLTVFWVLQFLGYSLVFLLPCRRNEDLVGCCAISLMNLVFFSKVFSPQFITWFSPFLLIEVWDRRYWVYYWLLQASVYLEFPVFFHYHILRPRFGWTWLLGGLGFYTFVFIHLFSLGLLSISLASQLRSGKSHYSSSSTM